MLLTGRFISTHLGRRLPNCWSVSGDPTPYRWMSATPVPTVQHAVCHLSSLRPTWWRLQLRHASRFRLGARPRETGRQHVWPVFRSFSRAAHGDPGSQGYWLFARPPVAFVTRCAADSCRFVEVPRREVVLPERTPPGVVDA